MYSHCGQKEHCVSIRSKVTKAFGESHRGQSTYVRDADWSNGAMRTQSSEGTHGRAVEGEHPAIRRGAAAAQRGG